MSTSAISGVNSWEAFNRMVNVAKARNSSLNMTEGVSETKSMPKVQAPAALSTKVYAVDKTVAAQNVVKGGRFDAYA